MFFTPTEAQLAQAHEAIPQIEATLAEHDAPQSPSDRDKLTIGPLMALFHRHARLFHELILGECGAIEDAGNAALKPFIANAVARARAVTEFDFIRRFQSLRDGLGVAADNVAERLRAASTLFAQFLNSPKP